MIPVWVRVKRDGTVLACPLAVVDGVIHVPAEPRYVIVGTLTVAQWQEDSDRSSAILRVRGWEWTTNRAGGRAMSKAAAVKALLASLGYHEAPADAANPGLFEPAP